MAYDPSVTDHIRPRKSFPSINWFIEMKILNVSIEDLSLGFLSIHRWTYKWSIYHSKLINDNNFTLTCWCHVNLNLVGWLKFEISNRNCFAVLSSELCSDLICLVFMRAVAVSQLNSPVSLTITRSVIMQLVGHALTQVDQVNHTQLFNYCSSVLWKQV